MSIEKIASSSVTEVKVAPKTPEVKNPQIRDDKPQIRDAEVRISEEALKLQKKEAEAPINNARVQQIKKAIEEGSFKIDPEKIADKMREEAADQMTRRLQQAYNVKHTAREMAEKGPLRG